MARAMWKGSLSFGLVTIPVSLTVAVKGKDIHFHQVHDADLGRIREKRICEVDGKEVPYEHVVKGFEVSKHQVVTLTREELKAADPEKDKLVTIVQFVPADEVDALYYERSYYLAPDGKAAAKAYGLFRAALEQSKQVAIARIVLSTQEHLCLIRAHDSGLLLTTMAFADEIEEAPEVGHATPTDKELKMALALIAQMEGAFEPKKFHDEHRKKVMALIQAKADGKPLKLAEPPRDEKITDLAEALEKSLRRGASPRPAARRPQRRAVARTSHSR